MLKQGRHSNTVSFAQRPLCKVRTRSQWIIDFFSLITDEEDMETSVCLTKEAHTVVLFGSMSEVELVDKIIPLHLQTKHTAWLSFDFFVVYNEEDTEISCAQTRKVARQRVVRLNDRRCNLRTRSHREAELRISFLCPRTKKAKTLRH